MQVRVLLMTAALASFGGMSQTAEAAVRVNATINGSPVACADAVNVKLTPAATRSAMRFTYECVAEGVARTCTPAAFVPGGFGDPDLQAGDPAFKYRASATGGPMIEVICDAEAGVAVKGTELVGNINGEPIAGCHPLQPIGQSTSLFSINTRPARSCGDTVSPESATGQCIEFRCPTDQANRTCFPVGGMTYASRMPEDHTALRRIALSCESQIPMLQDEFE